MIQVFLSHVDKDNFAPLTVADATEIMTERDEVTIEKDPQQLIEHYKSENVHLDLSSRELFNQVCDDVKLILHVQDTGHLFFV